MIIPFLNQLELRTMKNYILLLMCFITANELPAQCEDSGNYWNQSWTSCTISENPNPIRDNSHWILYEFHEPQYIIDSWVWNANREGESGLGFQNVVVDYSEDGENWIELGEFEFPRASESEDYEGFEGPKFERTAITKILLTVLSTHEEGNCASLAEIQFRIDEEACYGIIDACGVCDGPGELTWYFDSDNDGLGDINVSISDCEQPPGYVSNSDDACDNGALGWEEIGPLFSDNGCNGCHGLAASGGLNLTSYATAIMGGNKCGPNLLTGENFVNAIIVAGYDACGTPISLPSMNTRASGEFDEEELAMLQHWINGGAPEVCQDFDTSIDFDNDGFTADEDCNDMNAEINPDAEEIPNNDIDENCDGIIEIIDVDGDGFNSDEDCDDENEDINPDAEEIPNNDIDEDCDGQILIIDVDGDGFNSDEDCDDNNEDIYPGAEEIPNNGIDEDCDGMDLITSSHEINDIAISFYPNPTTTFLTIQIEGQLDYQVKLIDVTGRVMISKSNPKLLDVSNLQGGIYLLELEDQATKQRVVEQVVVVR